jgi:AraC family transcriptional regulator
MSADFVSLEPRLHLYDKPIQHILSSICAELRAENPVGRLYAESLATALAARLLRQYSGMRSPPGGLPKRQLQQLLEYIDENVARDLSLQELASVVSASGSHFNVLFKKSTGTSPHQFILRARVQRAVDLIIGSSSQLSEIALRCGFANQSHMSRCVRRFHGMTPAELRRQRA